MDAGSREEGKRAQSCRTSGTEDGDWKDRGDAWEMPGERCAETPRGGRLHRRERVWPIGRARTPDAGREGAPNDARSQGPEFCLSRAHEAGMGGLETLQRASLSTLPLG